MMPTVGAYPPAASNTCATFSSVLRAVLQFEMHDLPDGGRFNAIHCEHQRLLHKRILDALQVVVKRDDAQPSGLVCKVNDLVKCRLRIVVPSAEDGSHLAQRGENDCYRKLQQHRAGRAAQHDERRGWLRDLRDAAALHQHSTQDAE